MNKKNSTSLSKLNCCIQKRIFIVGCPRSGTTLIQKHLAAHTKIHTFPETQFFRRMFKSRKIIPWWAIIGLTKGKEYEKVKTLLKALNRSDLLEIYPRKVIFLKDSVKNFVSLLDKIALEKNKTAWVEKSPLHFRYTKFICKKVPHSHIIFVIRDGRDVVASIYDRAVKYPQFFAKQKNLKVAIDLWNEALCNAKIITNNMKFKKKVSFIFYENFVNNPEMELKRLFSEMDLPFQPNTITPTETYFIGKKEPWKEKAKSSTIKSKSKFKSLFDSENQKYIENHVDLNTYENLKRKPFHE